MFVYYLSVFLFYRLAKAVYNLYFHPLHKFPGPKLAAATHAYEFYYSIVRDGEFIWEIEKMHKQYGTGHLVPMSLFLSFSGFITDDLKVLLCV